MTDRELRRALLEFIRLGSDVLRKTLAEAASGTTLHLYAEGDPMTIISPNFQLNAGDSVVVTITDTDDVSGLPVTPDAGSVTAVLSSATDTVAVDPSGTFLTLTAGTTEGVGNTVTVEATVGGVASKQAVGTYDVIADVVPPDATSLSLSFGTETAPAAADGSAVPPGFVVNEATGGLDHV